MICQFTFRNYRSYRNEATFDFMASKADELSDTLIVDKNDGKRFLPVSVVYGPNAGGKSNLLKAFICLVSTVVHPIMLMEKAVISVRSMYCDNFQPFAFNETSKDEPTDFEIYFRISSKEYRYSLSLLDGEVLDESLFCRTIKGKKPALFFIRNGKVIEIGNSLAKYKVTASVNEKMPFLSFLAINYSIPEIDNIVSWFESCILWNYAEPLSETVLPLVTSKKERDTFISVLQGLDTCIDDYEIIYDEDQKIKDILIKRTLQTQKYSLSLKEESDGTQKLFRLLPLIIDSLVNGKLIVIDEMDAKLHPTLLKYLITLYNNPNLNINGAQLWFTSHDLTTMKNDVFRRDEIWFAYRDANESSVIYSLYDIRNLNNAHIDPKSAYDKQYLEGRYGSDPYFVNILNWEVCDESSSN